LSDVLDQILHVRPPDSEKENDADKGKLDENDPVTR